MKLETDHLDGYTEVRDSAPPRHVGIIMDGNGRWAASRAMPRTLGHKAGVDAVRRTVRAAGELGIEYLTLYAFSSENWSRPAEEVNDLLGLMKYFVKRDLAELCANGVRVRILGERAGLPTDILGLIEMAEGKSESNTSLYLNIAFNYGGRDEIIRACKRFIRQKTKEGQSATEITEADITACLDTGDIPDPDLIIRTSGEMRLSNFMLWQAAYAELVFLPCMWPDFDKVHLSEALEDYAMRSRRFGGVTVPKDIAL